MQERTGGNGEGGGRGINHQDLQMQILKFAQETRRHLADLSVLQVEIYLCNKNNPRQITSHVFISVPVHWVNNDVTRPRFPLEELVTVKHLYNLQYSVHCVNNNLNLRIKTEPVMAGADTRENVPATELFIYIYIYLYLFIFGSETRHTPLKLIQPLQASV